MLKIFEIFKRKKKAPAETTALAVADEFSLDFFDGKAQEAFDGRKASEIYEAFNKLARLRGKSVEDIKDESCLSQIRKFMKRVGKVVSGNPLSEAEMRVTVKNTDAACIKEICAEPSFLPEVKKAMKKEGIASERVTALIDFPFGGGMAKSRLLDIKEVRKQGVDGAKICLSPALFTRRNARRLKREINGYCRAVHGDVSICVKADAINYDNLKAGATAVEKSKARGIVLMFGDVNLDDVKDKLRLLSDIKGKKKGVIIGAKDVKSAIRLFSFGADEIYTPYADDIARELFGEFKIKSVKLA